MMTFRAPEQEMVKLACRLPIITSKVKTVKTLVNKVECLRGRHSIVIVSMSLSTAV